MDIAAWLRELDLAQYVQTFEDHDVDGQTLRHLTEADLAELGVKSVGHRRKLAAAIAALGDPPADTAAPQAEVAEQRQLTVLYAQMAAQRAGADAEALREVIQRFIARCTDVVSQYDGHIANFYGDCMLVYFGWPQAHEDDAERAVRAGLALMRRARESADGIGVRVGIATGPVVVGDLIHEGPARQQSAVGLTPNLAARVLSLAEDGQMLVDELTRQLVGGGFKLQSRGSHLLKGIARPVSAYAVLGEQAAASRFDLLRGREMVLMVGRDQELAMLLERWSQARSGEGQLVLLEGEAGIGKSRIARALLDACAGQPHWRVRWQCSPYHTGSPLWPVIQQIGREVGLQVQDAADASLDKLEVLAGEDRQRRALYAKLLGLEGSQRYGSLEMTPQLLRERTLEVLAEQLFELAERRPLLLVVEDVHWIDPTTQALIERCLDRIDRSCMLVLLTSRRDGQPTLAAHPSVTRLSLNRLNRSSVQEIVQRMAGSRLTPRTLAMIVAQSDGVPLFVEELTKAVMETGETSIPASLHGSLMARLDRLPEVKEVAQVAACIGREFDLALLQAISDNPEAVSAAIGKLIAAQLVFQRGERTNPRFIFKHALVQEAARESMLHRRREAIHARILGVLETQRPNTARQILAHHAAAAGLARRAVEHWREAGKAAQAKSAYMEAAAALESAIEMIRAQPADPGLQALELGLHLQLGVLLTHIARYGEAEACLRLALQLAVRVGDEASQAAAAEAMGRQFLGRGSFRNARQWLDRALATWQALGARREEGQVMLAKAMTWLPERFDEVRGFSDRALTIARQCGDTTTAILAAAELGHATTHLGDGRRGRALLDESAEHARRLDDSQVLITVLSRHASAAASTGDFTRAKALFVEVQRLAQEVGAQRKGAGRRGADAAERDLPAYEGLDPAAIAGVAVGTLRQCDFALARAARNEVLTLAEAMPDPLRECRILIALGYADARAGELDRAAASLQRASSVVSAYQLPMMQAEVLDNLGLVALARGDLDRAGSHLRESLALRRRIGSVLRIVYSLCGLIGLLARCGQSREAAIIAAAVRRECGTHGLVVDEGTQAALEEALAIVHSSLQTHELESARVQGEALALDDVVKLALAA